MASSLYYLTLHVVLLLLATNTSAYDATDFYCKPDTIISPTNPTHSSIYNFAESIIPNFERGATFLESSFGTGENVIYSLAQCRGDVDLKICLDCINNSSTEILLSCPDYTDARIWRDYCFLRYSQEKFYGIVDTSVGALFLNPENVTSTPAETFSKILATFFNDITSDAIKPSSGGLGTGVMLLSQFETLYGLAQCTKDLTARSCAKCLEEAVESFNEECSGSKGCRVMYASCSVRYELYPFFFPLPVGFESEKIPDHESVKKLIIHR